MNFKDTVFPTPSKKSMPLCSAQAALSALNQKSAHCKMWCIWGSTIGELYPGLQRHIYIPDGKEVQEWGSVFSVWRSGMGVRSFVKLNIGQVKLEVMHALSSKTGVQHFGPLRLWTCSCPPLRRLLLDSRSRLWPCSLYLVFFIVANTAAYTHFADASVLLIPYHFLPTEF